MKPIRSCCVSLVTASLLIIGCEGTLKPSRQNPADYTAFDAAVEGCDLLHTKQLLAKTPNLINEKGWSDTTPLYLAALNNCTEVAAFLLEKGASVNAKSKSGATPLHIAAQKNNLALARLLLAHGADILALDSERRTPADRAAQWHHPEMAAYLKQRESRQ